MCSPKDQLNKKDGREISATRCLICEAPESTKVQASRKELLLTIKKQLIAGELSFFEVDGTELCPKWYDEFPRKYKERQQELFSDLN